MFLYIFLERCVSSNVNLFITNYKETNPRARTVWSPLWLLIPIWLDEDDDDDDDDEHELVALAWRPNVDVPGDTVTSTGVGGVADNPPEGSNDGTPG